MDIKPLHNFTLNARVDTVNGIENCLILSDSMPISETQDQQEKENVIVVSPWQITNLLWFIEHNCKIEGEFNGN